MTPKDYKEWDEEDELLELVPSRYRDLVGKPREEKIVPNDRGEWY